MLMFRRGCSHPQLDQIVLLDELGPPVVCLAAVLEDGDEAGKQEQSLVDANDVLEVGDTLLEAFRDAVEVGHLAEVRTLQRIGRQRAVRRKVQA